MDPSLAVVLEALPERAVAPAPALLSDPGVEGSWPGVENPDGLRAQLRDWLSQYANAGTRRTYAYALGLPIPWVDAISGSDEAAALSPQQAAQDRQKPSRRPPPAGHGPLHDLAWFRWLARRALDPRAATAGDVKAWLHALDAAGASRRTRQRMLSTLAALYSHLVDAEVIAANPTSVNRRRLELTVHAHEASPTARLTAEQVHALLEAAGRLPHGRGRYAELYSRRATAVLALLTLGLRISEVVGLDRRDLYRTGGEEVLRVRGKGKVQREVYLTAPVRDALTAYLAVRDRLTGAAAPVPRGRGAAVSSPMLTTRSGTRVSRMDLYTLVRRVAAHAGDALEDVRVHPHALRHAYVTIALEHGARIQHVQVDVGHKSIATTRHYDQGSRTRATSAADLVADAIARDPASAAEGGDVCQIVS